RDDRGDCRGVLRRLAQLTRREHRAGRVALPVREGMGGDRDRLHFRNRLLSRGGARRALRHAPAAASGSGRGLEKKADGRGQGMGRKHWVIAGLAAAILLSVGTGTAAAKPQARKLDNITLQLKWVTQSQFAGYYAALTNGYYKDFGLNVTLKVGGPSITPETVV